MVIVLTGKNAYALKATLDGIVSTARKDIGDIGIEKIDANEADIDTILQSVQSLPFLAPSKLVVVQNAQSNQALMDRVEEVIERTADEVKVVLVGPVFDKRKSTWNVLKKRADDVQEFSDMKPFELPKWVVEQAKGNGATINARDAAYLVDRVGPDQMMLASELKKLSINAAAIDRSAIDELTEQNPQSTIFEMLDAAFSGNKARAVELYRDQRKKRVEPHYIVAMLMWQLHALALAVFADPATEQTLVAAGQSPFSARKSLNLARKIRRSDVKKFINDLAELDVNIKTSAEPDSALELYLLSLTTS